jgi:hypothetical protein
VARYPRQTIEPGTVFAELTVLEEVDPGPPHNRRVRCLCVCGTEKIAFLGNLRSGRTRSCGCTYVFGAKSREAILASRRKKAQETDAGRLCFTCQTWKTWENFRVDPRRAYGKASNCTECGRWRNMKAVYGICRAEWEGLRDGQDSRCALCGEAGEDSELFVDHDHACCPGMRGQGDVKAGCRKCIRGLLCDSCNRVLGRIEQKPALAKRFADYLERRPLA